MIIPAYHLFPSRLSHVAWSNKFYVSFCLMKKDRR